MTGTKKPGYRAQGKARVGKDLDLLIEKKPNDPRVLRATKFIKKK